MTLVSLHYAITIPSLSLSLSHTLPRSVLAHISEEQHRAHCAPPLPPSSLVFIPILPSYFLRESQTLDLNLNLKTFLFSVSSSGYGGSVGSATGVFLDGGVARGRERAFCSGFDDAVVEANSPLLRRSSEGFQVFAVGDKRQCRSVVVEEEQQRLLPSPVKQ